MASLANDGTITTTQIQVAWSVGTAHNFIITNLNDGPVRITVTPNNGLEFSTRQLGHAGGGVNHHNLCLLYTSPSPRDRQKSRMPSSA